MKLLVLVTLPAAVLGFAPASRRSSKSSPLCAKKEATFGMGCFWKPAEEILKVDGVLDTVAGYTGNPLAEKAPTYDSVCFGNKWVEGVRVYYDDDKVTYQQLLNAFFEAQEPKMGSRQYASIVFPHDAEQQEIAEAWKEQEQVRPDGVPVSFTQLEPLSKFYQAEGYHQKYWAKQRPRFAVILGLLALSSGFADSVLPSVALSNLPTVANALTLAIAGYVMLERVIDAKVEEI